MKSSYNQLDNTAIENLVNNTISINEDVSKTISNGFYGFRLNGSNRIVSSSTFTTKFTFFFVMSADDTSSGRLITSHEENILFGYWGTRLGSFWINENINLQGFSSKEGNIQFLICRNDNDVKTAWRYDKMEKKLKKCVTDSTAGRNSWGKMVIGKPVLANEIGKGHLYEAICIQNTLTDEQVHIVFDRIKKNCLLD